MAEGEACLRDKWLEGAYMATHGRAELYAIDPRNVLGAATFSRGVAIAGSACPFAGSCSKVFVSHLTSLTHHFSLYIVSALL
jgi:hypothetical protein